MQDLWTLQKITFLGRGEGGLICKEWLLSGSGRREGQGLTSGSKVGEGITEAFLRGVPYVPTLGGREGRSAPLPSAPGLMVEGKEACPSWASLPLLTGAGRMGWVPRLRQGVAGNPLTDGHNFQNHKSLCQRLSLAGVQVLMADMLKGEVSAVLT